jgi:putative transposase
MTKTCLQELRWLYDCRDLTEAKADLAAWLTKWSGRYEKLTDWVEETIEETFTYYRLPRQHHKHLKSSNMLERLSEEIKHALTWSESFLTQRVVCGWCGPWP